MFLSCNGASKHLYINIAHAKATVYVDHNARGTDTILYTKHFLIWDWQQLIGESGICQIIQFFLHFNLLKCAWGITVIFWNDMRGMQNFLCLSYIPDVVNQWKSMESRHFPYHHVALVPTVGCAWWGYCQSTLASSLWRDGDPWWQGHTFEGYIFWWIELINCYTCEMEEVSIGDCLCCFV